MKIHHSPRHWISVALVFAALLLTQTAVHGQGIANRENTKPSGDNVKPPRDQSLAKDQRSVKKAKRATKRTISRARHGTSEIDSGVAAGAK